LDGYSADSPYMPLVLGSASACMIHDPRSQRESQLLDVVGRTCVDAGRSSTTRRLDSPRSATNQTNGASRRPQLQGEALQLQAARRAQ
jgi:hypothetical protein